MRTLLKEEYVEGGIENSQQEPTIESNQEDSLIARLNQIESRQERIENKLDFIISLLSPRSTNTNLNNSSSNTLNLRLNRQLSESVKMEIEYDPLAKSLEFTEVPSSLSSLKDLVCKLPPICFFQNIKFQTIANKQIIEINEEDYLNIIKNHHQNTPLKIKVKEINKK